MALRAFLRWLPLSMLLKSCSYRRMRSLCILFKRITPPGMSPWSIRVNTICQMHLTLWYGVAAQPGCEVHPMMVHNEPHHVQYAGVSPLADRDRHCESS